MSVKELVALIKIAAAEAANYQSRFAAEDTEARRIVEVMEDYLKKTGRVIYGGAAINAYMSPETKFYDPRLYLPDYDLMTPDPLQDCASLIAAFQQDGFQDVEAKLGIHEGTYKVFVNYRPAADITYMPSNLYARILADSSDIEGLRFASPDFLRMNMYLELSRPAGDTRRWEKVYERLLLLNKEHPLQVKRCRPLNLGSQIQTDRSLTTHDKIMKAGIEEGAVFLSVPPHLGLEPRVTEIVLMIIENPTKIIERLPELRVRHHNALGELVAPRVELFRKRRLVAVIFQSVACHAYVGDKPRIGSIDLLIHMYYGLYFARLERYMPRRILCVIQTLIDLEADTRKKALVTGDSVFPLECVGHQPLLPELKRAHRKRVEAKRKEFNLIRRSIKKK
jgi:hypothetical protein